MNRAQLQLLAEDRIRDAEILLAAGQWSGAYYLAGYSVECGLKACIAKRVNQHDFPNKDFAVKSHTHNILSLVDTAGLVSQRNLDVASNPILKANWITVKDWNEAARYERWTAEQARLLFEAVSDSKNGVLPWIRIHW